MRISFSESRTAGFKKWSDARRPAQRQAKAGDISDGPTQDGDLTRADPEDAADALASNS
jgi:hypothetical protein